MLTDLYQPNTKPNQMAMFKDPIPKIKTNRLMLITKCNMEQTNNS